MVSTPPSLLSPDTLDERAYGGRPDRLTLGRWVRSRFSRRNQNPLSTYEDYRLYRTLKERSFSSVDPFRPPTSTSRTRDVRPSPSRGKGREEGPECPSWVWGRLDANHGFKTGETPPGLQNHRSDTGRPNVVKGDFSGMTPFIGLGVDGDQRHEGFSPRRVGSPDRSPSAKVEVRTPSSQT